MGVVGPEGLTQVSRIKRLRCLTIPGALKRGLGLRGKCLTVQTTTGPRRFQRGPSLPQLPPGPWIYRLAVSIHDSHDGLPTGVAHGQRGLLA
jgi:hypothetical protein